MGAGLIGGDPPGLGEEGTVCASARARKARRRETCSAPRALPSTFRGVLASRRPSGRLFFVSSMDFEFDPGGAVASLSEAEAAHYRALLADLLALAVPYRFDVAPNPCVGAAVLSDGVEIGRGFHRAWGGPHAEVLAIEAARASGDPRERWDTLVVTLEPCSSHGKTPPCTEAILREPFRRVVIGALDPDPRHRGRGPEELRARGLEIVFLRGAAPLERAAPHFLEW